MYLLLHVALMGIFSKFFITNALTLEPLPRNKRMTHGKDSLIEEFPYLVALERKLDGHHLCGGAIISQNHLLTAAHCLYFDHKNSSLYQVRAGSTYREKGGVVHQVRNFTIHPSYDGNKADLAVVQLEEPIKFDDTKQPIAMFEFGEESEPVSVATTLGWGKTGKGKPKTDHLQRIHLYIMDKDPCNDFWTKAGEGIEKGEICAADIDGSKSTCNGDSGGPLVINEKLAGITSYANRYCTSSPEPNVFTEIAYFRKWIDKTVAALS